VSHAISAAAQSSSEAIPSDLPAARAVVFSAGYAGVFRDSDGTALGLEYRFRESRRGLHTAALIGWTGDTRYLNLSLGYARSLGPGWYGIVCAGPGIYSHDGADHDLGGPLEFLTRIELARSLGNGRRVGIMLAHISNAHIGWRNPGNEILSLTYALPLGR
jgi:lipid A 3-O-deacylase